MITVDSCNKEFEYEMLTHWSYYSLALSYRVTITEILSLKFGFEELLEKKNS